MAVRTPDASADAEKRLLSSRSTDADLLSAAALAQQVGAAATADDLKALAVRNRAEARLAARRARNLADVWVTPESEASF